MKPKLLTTLEGYSRPQLVSDIIAGVTVALVALPLSIAIAIASGAPPATGIITAIIGGFLISLLGGSRVQIGGPTGAFIVLVYDVIARHGYDGLVLATAMCGVILIVAGLLKAGKLVALVPEPVIDGFTIGIAVVIGISQLKDFMGMETGAMPADFLEKLPVLWAARESFNLSATLIGLGTIIAIALLRKIAPRLPGSLIAVAAASLLVVAASLPVESVTSVYGALPSGLPAPHLPEITQGKVLDLLPSALAIAFLAGVESLLSATVADRLVKGAHRPRAELLAQGVANLGASLFGGLPATGAIARTATNVRAGGRTPIAGMVHALIIWAMVALAAPLAGAMVLPALAGLLLITAWTMAEPDRWGERLAQPLPDKLLLFLTAGLTVLVDLTVAIAVGTLLGLALQLQRNRAAKAGQDD